MTPKPLNRENAHVPIRYPERVVQFGGGNFLRAFVDWMVDRLNEKTDFAGSVVIVKPTPSGSYDNLQRQDGLFHVRARGVQAGQVVDTTQLVTSVSRVVNPYEDYRAFLSLAEQPDLRFMVSNTTEAGIIFVPEDQPDNTPPSSFPAKLTAFLYHRYQHFQGDGSKGFILLPCELVDENCKRLQKTLIQYANHWTLGNEFKDWLLHANQFCNTLVDRIVSGFPTENAESIFNDIGFEDHLLVDAEPFYSWVIEGGETVAEEFPVQQAGLNVKFTDDVRVYQNMKVRILNGAHTSMAVVGYLLGCETVGDVMSHPQAAAFIQGLIDEEIQPFVAISENERNSFAADTLDRYRNPYLHHRLLSIALNALSKFRVRLLPTLEDYVQHHHALPPRVVFSFAALIRFYKGDWQGQSIPLSDNLDYIEWFANLWRDKPIPELVVAVLANETLWGRDLRDYDRLAEQLSRYLSMLENTPPEQILISAIP